MIRIQCIAGTFRFVTETKTVIFKEWNKQCFQTDGGGLGAEECPYHFSDGPLGGHFLLLQSTINHNLYFW